MTGKVALVTGAGSGIGRAGAIALAGKGYHLMLAGRRHETLKETAALCPTEVECVSETVDVGDEASVVALFVAHEARFGRLDVLFNNAGIGGPFGTPDSVDGDAWRRVMDTNISGSFYCAREAFRLMRHQNPQGGRIINNGSISAHSPRPGSIAYTTSKHAITGMTKSIALDGRPFNIACGQIDIGNAATDMASRISQGVPQANGDVKAEPVMDVSRVAEAVCFMADLPLDSNVPFMTIMATNMPFIGRG